MELKPFWNYYGGKWRLAPKYPAPACSTIVEPFAGAAGYSLRHHTRRVILVEKYPVIAGIWRYLIATPSVEILQLPTVDHVDELPGATPQEARWLVGMCLNTGTSSPRRSLSSGLRKHRVTGHGDFCGWTEARRRRVARQVEHIRHWRVIEGDFILAPRIAATWFVDPPYAGRAGSRYVYGSSGIDYAELGAWCRRRAGQIIVC